MSSSLCYLRLSAGLCSLSHCPLASLSLLTPLSLTLQKVVKIKRQFNGHGKENCQLSGLSIFHPVHFIIGYYVFKFRVLMTLCHPKYQDAG